MNNYDQIKEKNKIRINPLLSFSKNKISLKKEKKYKKTKIKISSPLIKYKNEKDIEILKEKVKIFLTVMNRDCKNFNHSIFFKNFKKTFFDIGDVQEKLKKGTIGSVEIGPVNILK